MFEIDDDPKIPGAAGTSSSSDIARLGPPITPASPPSTVSPPVVPASAGRPTYTGWRVVRGIARILLFGGAITLALGMRNKGSLPHADEMVPEVHRAPMQSDTSRAPFSFSYRGSSYTVTPQAEYEISGVVVTHNNISGIGDAYHTSDSVDMKDVCVVWGSNVLNDNYRSMKYASEPWTCVIETQDSTVWNRFFPDELSNNHLLAADEAVQQRIRSVRVGDQIHFRGMLVDYCPAQYPEMVRHSSLVRTDTGNGACEVVFVEDFQILKRATPGWYLVYSLGWWSLGLAVALRAFMVIKAPYGA